MHSKNIYHELTSLVSLLKNRCKFYCESRAGGTGGRGHVPHLILTKLKIVPSKNFTLMIGPHTVL
jgi:hypothetical protein